MASASWNWAISSPTQGCQFAFFEAKFVMFGLFSILCTFFKNEKRPNAIWIFLAFFGHIDFSCQFGGFKDDFGRFLGTGRFLDTHTVSLDTE